MANRILLLFVLFLLPFFIPASAGADLPCQLACDQAVRVCNNGCSNLPMLADYACKVACETARGECVSRCTEAVSPPSKQQTLSPAPPPKSAASNPEAEKQLLNHAIQLMTEGKPEAAKGILEALVKTYPQSPLVPQAQGLLKSLGASPAPLPSGDAPAVAAPPPDEGEIVIGMKTSVGLWHSNVNARFVVHTHPPVTVRRNQTIPVPVGTYNVCVETDNWRPQCKAVNVTKGSVHKFEWVEWSVLIGGLCKGYYNGEVFAGGGW